MNEDEMKYFVSLLFEALGELSELSERINKLEEQFKQLSLNRNPTEVALSNNNTRSIPISQLVNTELSDDIKNDIDKAVDFILKYSKNIPYIINK